ncbi:MAG: response regulator transcription factor [Burkholderiales bacterium]
MQELPLRAMNALDPGIPIAYLRTKSGATLRVRACGIPADAPGGFHDDALSGLGPLAPRARASYTEPHARMFLLEYLWGDGPVLTALLVGFGFTPREAEIALLTVRGLSNKQIARRLGDLSSNSVRDCLRRVFAKVQVCSRTELIARVLRIECPNDSDPPPEA